MAVSDFLGLGFRVLRLCFVSLRNRVFVFYSIPSVHGYEDYASSALEECLLREWVLDSRYGSVGFRFDSGLDLMGLDYC